MVIIKISSPDSSNFTEQEIDEFTEVLNSEFPNNSIIQKIDIPSKGFGFIYWELLQVWIEEVPGEIRGAIISRILEHGIRIIKKSFKRADKKLGRPQAVVIYDKDGNEIEIRVLSSGRQKGRTKKEFEKWVNREKLTQDARNEKAAKRYCKKNKFTFLKIRHYEKHSRLYFQKNDIKGWANFETKKNRDITWKKKSPKEYLDNK